MSPRSGRGDPLRLVHDHLARVPAAPVERNATLPAALSQILMHLLEKDPDARYQSAESLLHDLECLREPQRGPVRIGERDVPPRLLPPSRLVGREQEAAALETALDAAIIGRCPAVLVAGAPGIGKTALVNGLRTAVMGHGGWFVTGKFDKHRRDLEFDGVFQAFNALFRLLLAEPDAELAQVRERAITALGPNAGLAPALSPEAAAFLRVPPDPGDPLTAQVRAQRSSVDLLRAVASRERPVVFFVDDLQWAGRTPLGLFDLVLAEGPIEGLLLVGAYREADLDPAHPLVELLTHSREVESAVHLRLDNLSPPNHVALIAQTLRADSAVAGTLAEAIGPNASGNPYETVEVLNALRRDGLLSATPSGWRWDGAAVRNHLGHTEIAALTAARVESLPRASADLLAAMACLGGRAELRAIQTATGEPPATIERLLAPALEDGLLLAENGLDAAVRFRHDRIRETILDLLGERHRHGLQLAMARRLATVPEFVAVAAEQYLPVVEALDDPDERRRVARLLQRAAEQGVMIGDNRLVNALLSAALRLIAPDQTDALIEAHTARHAALYGLARLDEADDDYHAITALAATALQRADATVVQVHALTHRNRIPEALALGWEVLGGLGIAVEVDRIPADLDDQFAHLYRWLEAGDDPGRAEIAEPTLVAATRLINAMLPAAFLAGDVIVVAWLALEALRIWREHGPGPTLIGPASHAAFVAVALRGDYDAAYRAYRRILALGEARRYEPDSSQARFVFSVQGHWFEPVENIVEAARRAREGLSAGGDVANVGYTYHPTVEGLLDCAPSVDDWVTEVEAGLAFVRRVGSEGSGQWLDCYRWLGAVLRDDSLPAAEPDPIDRFAGHPAVLFHALVTRAIAAAIFDDLDDLSRHTAAAMPLLRAFESLYPSVWVRVLRGLALAAQARASEGEARADRLSELDELRQWLAERAADAPDNFLHLVRLLDAERLWAAGDFRGTLMAFNAARREVSQRQRPWHQALITERAARFRLAHGLDHEGHELLAAARREYLSWGATAKVDQLDWAYPALRSTPEAIAGDDHALPDRRSTVTTGTIDLMGILSASQALSSETSIDRLHARVVDVLGNMTGATRVHLVLWSHERQGWLLPAPGEQGLSVVGEDGELPQSVLRYVQRTGEPLLVGDAASDDRFATDPYFSGAGVCSLLGVPILTRGTLGAVLLLENRLVRGAFSRGRLEGVKLIAGQLAVSLDNAQVNAEYRRIAEDQAALRRVAVLAASAMASGDLFATVAEEVGTVLGADFTLLTRYGPDREVECMGAWSTDGPTPFVGRRMELGDDDVSTLVFERRGPARVDRVLEAGEQAGDSSRPFGGRVAVGAPITVADRLWGAMIVGATAGSQLPPGTEDRLAAFTELVATAIANAQSRAELEASRARLVTEADAARRRVVRDLHDGAQQRLIHSLITLGLAQRSLALGDGEAQALLAEATTTCNGRTRSCASWHTASSPRTSLAAGCGARSMRSWSVSTSTSRSSCPPSGCRPRSRRAPTSSWPRRSRTSSSTPAPSPPR